MILDHIALTADTLEEGAATVAAALGIAPLTGGRHAAMGTHNLLLGMGDTYFEVIAIDPQATPPGRPRWFDIDSFSGAPRLTNWILRCDDLDAALARAPAGAGRPTPFSRGDLRWKMALPDDGRLPFDGCFPALIEWQGEARGPAHPARRLPDSDCRLTGLTLTHPQASALRAALAPLIADPRVRIVEGQAPAISAGFDTPDGPREL